MLKKINLIKTIAISFCLCASGSVLAAGKATVEVIAKGQPDKRVELTFKTLPSADLAINKDGPWKLEVLSSGNLKFDKKELKRGDWKEDIAGFTLLSSPAKTKNEKVKYKLTAFICTKDKSQCFREVVEGVANVKW
ncbi:MAG: hypothetical protein WCL28_12695 [bacterium]